MSKKGAYVYQQIERTTAEWAGDTTVYPASVWLFERLENGRFNMRLADGVHTFAELPPVMQDVGVRIKKSDPVTYILTFSTAAGEFDTPNLRGDDAPVPSIDPATKRWKIGDEDTGVVAEGKDGESYDDREIRTALSAMQGRLDALVSGNASKAIDSFNEIVAFLASVEDSETLRGIIAGLNQEISNARGEIPTRLSQLQNDNHTVTDPDYTHTDNNYTDEEKRRVALPRNAHSIVSAESVGKIPVSHEIVQVSVSANASLALEDPAAEGLDGVMIHVLVHNTSTSARTVTIPTTGGYNSYIGSSVSIPASGWAEINLLRDTSGLWHIMGIVKD